jgi:hypothetical protein
VETKRGLRYTYEQEGLLVGKEAVPQHFLLTEQKRKMKERCQIRRRGGREGRGEERERRKGE